MASQLEQQAVIRSTTPAEHDAHKAHVEGMYGPGGVNAGKLPYVIDDVAMTVTLTSIIPNYRSVP